MTGRPNLRAVDASAEGEIDFGPLDSSLGFLLRMTQIEVFELFYETLGRLGLKPGEFSVLWLVHRNPGVRQGLVADTLRIKPAHMTKLVRTFEEGGMLDRHVPENDRRGIELRLTDKGEGFVTEYADEFFSYAQSETNRLSRKEAAQLISLLQKFTRLGGAK